MFISRDLHNSWSDSYKNIDDLTRKKTVTSRVTTDDRIVFFNEDLC